MRHLNLHLKGFARERGGESETAQFGRDARRDWQAVCFVFLLFTLVPAAFGIFVYARIDTGELFLVDKERSVVPGSVNRFELEKTVAFFEEKRQRFESLKSRPFSISDPGPAIAPKQ